MLSRFEAFKQLFSGHRRTPSTDPPGNTNSSHKRSQRTKTASAPKPAPRISDPDPTQLNTGSNTPDQWTNIPGGRHPVQDVISQRSYIDNDGSTDWNDQTPSHQVPPANLAQHSGESQTPTTHVGSKEGPGPLPGEIMTTTRRQVTSDSISPSPNSLPMDNQGGTFAGAHDFKMENPILNDNSCTYNSRTYHSRTYNYFVNVQPVMDHLTNAGAPEAVLDSAARFPPPQCYPGTRTTIQNKLCTWLLNFLRRRSVIWLFGPAGVGKSAIAQTFAECAKEQGLLGAAFFFSCTQNAEKRSDPGRVIPTLACQLAINNDHYQRFITERIAGNPLLLSAQLEVQFRQLIVEPFLYLASDDARRVKNSLVIVIDGLDECRDEKAQCKLVDLIKGAAQLKPPLPLIWLICSRKEPHIMYTFSQLDYTEVCDREELTKNKEAHADVERFLRARFAEIYERYRDLISIGADGSWPSEADFTTILREVDGHFIIASVAERFVGDPTVNDPESQLTSLLSILRGLSEIKINDKNPLEVVDVFYSRILAKVSMGALPIVMQVLGLCAYDLGCVNVTMRIEGHHPQNFTTQQLWLYLDTAQGRFYSATWALHSVINIPPPEDAAKRGLTFYHKSFVDYLINARRSKKFHVSKEQAKRCQAACSLHLYNLILQHENCARVDPPESCYAESVLKAWFGGQVLGNQLSELKNDVIYNYEYQKIMAPVTTAPGSSALHNSNLLHDFGFDLLPESKTTDDNTLPAPVLDLSRDPRTPHHFLRTQIEDSKVDTKLLEHLSLLTDGGLVEPLDLSAPDPLKKILGTIGFVIVGQGSKSGLACIAHGLMNEWRLWRWQVIWLNAASPPTTEQKSLYKVWAQKRHRRPRT